MEKLKDVFWIMLIVLTFALNELGRVNYESRCCSRFTKFFSSGCGFCFSTGLALIIFIVTCFNDAALIYSQNDVHRLQHFAMILIWVWPLSFIADFLRQKNSCQTAEWYDLGSTHGTTIKYQWVVVVFTTAAIVSYIIAVFHAVFWHGVQ